MVLRCIIPGCPSHNDKNKPVLWAVPAMPKEQIYIGAMRKLQEKKNNIKRCQHDAWTKAISLGYGEFTKYSDTRNMRICINHFHPSVIDLSSDGKPRLKVGAAPTMNLTKFSMENENFKENKNLSRIVGTKEDLQDVCNDVNSNVSNIVTPTRQERSNKRSYEHMRLEKEKTEQFKRKNTIQNMNHLCDELRQVCSAWEMHNETNNISKWRRNMHNDDGLFSACQEITIIFDESEKLCNMFLSTPSNIVLEPIENSNVNVIKDIQHDNITHMGYGCVHKIAELFHNVEEEHKHTPSSEKK